MIQSMSTATSPATFTPDDLLSMPDGDRYELVDGQLTELNMSGLSSLIATEINRRLANFAREGKLGLVLQSDCGYQCFPDDPLKVRRPDGSFIRDGRLTLGELQQGYLHLVPDLAVEVVSPRDTVYELETKVEEYLAAGVSLVWVVNPETRIVEVHRIDGSVSKLHVADDLTGGEVLPGFCCRVGDLFSLADITAK
jgi:Uma2 family endonuclease